MTRGGSVSFGLPSSAFVRTSLAGCTPGFHGTQKIRPLSKTDVHEDGELEDILDELVLCGIEGDEAQSCYPED